MLPEALRDDAIGHAATSSSTAVALDCCPAVPVDWVRVC
jgi:hypothetical protein